MKIPQAWYESAEIMARASVVCDEFLRGTKRIVCVELYSSMVALREGIIHDWLVGTEVRNNYHDYDPSLDWRLLINGNVAASNSPNEWWRLVDFFDIPK
ncbi:hypothetical protein NKH55_13065 [Mesorhizobium opportunistum]|uniref:hypothetical protein n=1 Tax=Mesorhizobium opportunistum TaxID=593909 RepID=UPI0033388002